MSENRYAVPLDELERTSHVRAAEQVEVQSDPLLPEGLFVIGPRYGDGATADADGD